MRQVEKNEPKAEDKQERRVGGWKVEDVVMGVRFGGDKRGEGSGEWRVES